MRGDRHAIDRDRALHQWLETDDGIHQRTLPVSLDPRHTEDLA
jgi:hypothetical protein